MTYHVCYISQKIDIEESIKIRALLSEQLTRDLRSKYVKRNALNNRMKASWGVSKRGLGMENGST